MLGVVEQVETAGIPKESNKMAVQNNVVPFPRRRRAPRVANPMTEELASKIKTLVIMKGMAQQTVAAQLGVNQGRVSEVVNGHLFPDAPFWPINDDF